MPSGVPIRYHAGGRGEIRPLILGRSEYQDPGGAFAYDGATPNALDLGIHKTDHRFVIESWSRAGRGEYR